MHFFFADNLEIELISYSILNLLIKNVSAQYVYSHKPTLARKKTHQHTIHSQLSQRPASQTQLSKQVNALIQMNSHTLVESLDSRDSFHAKPFQDKTASARYNQQAKKFCKLINKVSGLKFQLCTKLNKNFFSSLIPVQLSPKHTGPWLNGDEWWKNCCHFSTGDPQMAASERSCRQVTQSLLFLLSAEPLTTIKSRTT